MEKFRLCYFAKTRPPAPSPSDKIIKLVPLPLVPLRSKSFMEEGGEVYDVSA